MRGECTAAEATSDADSPLIEKAKNDAIAAFFITRHAEEERLAFRQPDGQHSRRRRRKALADSFVTRFGIYRGAHAGAAVISTCEAWRQFIIPAKKGADVAAMPLGFGLPRFTQDARCRAIHLAAASL